MANYGKRGNSPQWKGGMRVASNGYILIRVDVGHHLRMRNGYAYEHQMVAEQMLGRRLASAEIVHHKDGDKANNDPSNLEVHASQAHHFMHHRKRDDLRNPDEPNPQIACACGCGDQLAKYDGTGRPRRFVHGHAVRLRRKEAISGD
jgi:hypothetical protein